MGDSLPPQTRNNAIVTLGGLGARVASDQPELAAGLLESLKDLDPDVMNAADRQLAAVGTWLMAVLAGRRADESAQIAALSRLVDMGDDALDTFDVFIAASWTKGQPSMIARGRLMKAVVLANHGREDEAVELVDELLREFGGDSDADVQHVLRAARLARAELRPDDDA